MKEACRFDCKKSKLTTPRQNVIPKFNIVNEVGTKQQTRNKYE
jgi:hypothetical protein